MRLFTLLGAGLLCAALTAPVLANDISAIADAYTQTDSPNANFGLSGITAVAVGRITLLQFNAAAIAQTTGSRATLNIRVVLAKNSSDGVSARLITSPWNEKTVTAKTLPSIADVNWFDSGSVTLEGATLNNGLSVGATNLGFGPTSVMRSTINGGVSVSGGVLDLESSVVTGDVVLLNSSGALKSAQVTGTISLQSDNGVPFTATCDRVFDRNLVSRPANCVEP